MIHRIFKISLIAMVVASCISPERPTLDILPLPVSVEEHEGVFNARFAGVCYDSALDDQTVLVISDFAEDLRSATCLPHRLKAVEGIADNRCDGFNFVLCPEVSGEAYTLEVAPDGVVVYASSRSGFINAIATIKQMLPVQIYGGESAITASWIMPCATIKDEPRFGYRGMHLDVSRHFFDVNEVKKYLDIMAVYKLNRFHWHLSDDQGWRVEIKSHPELAEIGQWRDGTVIKKDWDSNDGIRYGGFFTQDELREVVAYADRLGITVIPEIDLPGHMLGVLASHPELGCTGGPYKVWQRWGVSSDVLCVGKEETFALLEDILAELVDIFPAEYFHIGGDECPKTEWAKCPCCQAKIKELGLKSDKKGTAEQKLQNYVTSRLQAFLATKGKRIIGWDEILEGELGEGATVMSWRGTKGGIAAAKAGFDAIMAPHNYMYFDYYQSENHDNEPFSIGGFLPLEKVYECNPTAGLDEEQSKHILGAQANLWTEYIASPEHLEYMLLPRMFALCEVQWCQYETRDIERLRSSISNHQFMILNQLGYNYRPL